MNNASKEYHEIVRRAGVRVARAAFKCASAGEYRSGLQRKRQWRPLRATQSDVDWAFSRARWLVDNGRQERRVRQWKTRRNWHTWNCRPRATPFNMSTPLEHRLHTRIMHAVEELLPQCLHHYMHEVRPQVSRTEDPTHCWITIHKEKSWYNYGGTIGRHQIISRAQYSLTLLKGWCLLPEDIKCSGCLFTLGAVRILEAVTEPDEEIWDARWAAQGRGEPKMQTGYIVVWTRDGIRHISHAASVPQARVNLCKRLAARGGPETAPRERTLRVCYDIGGNPDVWVYIKDSIEAGNCREGTRAWINRYFPRQKRATVQELMDALKHGASEQHHVRAACRVAIRRHYQELKKKAA